MALFAAVCGACTADPDEDDVATLRAAQTGSPNGAWYDDYPAATVTLIEDADPAGAVRTMYGSDAVQMASKEAAEQAASGGEQDWVAAGKIGDWTFVWEDNGWQGSDADKAAALSRGTHLVSAFWNVNELALATVADDGRVTRQFDPATRTDPANAVGNPLPDEEWLDWDHDWVGSLLRLQSRLTGQRIADPSWLGRPQVRFWTHAEDSE